MHNLSLYIVPVAPHPLVVPFLRDSNRLLRSESSVNGHMAPSEPQVCACTEGSRGSRCQKEGWFKFNCMAGPVSPPLLSLSHAHSHSLSSVPSHRHHLSQQQQQQQQLTEPVRRRSSSSSSSPTPIRPPGLYVRPTEDAAREGKRGGGWQQTLTVRITFHLRRHSQWHCRGRQQHRLPAHNTSQQ